MNDKLTLIGLSSVKPLIQKILERPHQHDWSLQGLGMLRLYLTDELRLHIWHSAFRVPDVSMMHTHPWHFHSLIVAGEVIQNRYAESDTGLEYHRQTILCGPGGGLLDEPPQLVKLKKKPDEHYSEGEVYSQLANEIHVSVPRNGTVTLIQREFLDDTEHAYVFWESGGEWVSAEPRRAVYGEVKDITQHALKVWF